MTTDTMRAAVGAMMELVSEFGQCRWSEGAAGATYLDRAGERRSREEAADLYKQIEECASKLAASTAAPKEEGGPTDTQMLDWLVEEGNQRVQDAIGNPLLTGINIGNGSMDIGMEGPGPQLLAGMFLGMFDKHPDAKNYIEVHMTSAKGNLIVTVRKAEGKSPDALKREAEQRVAELEKKLAAFSASSTGGVESE